MQLRSQLGKHTIAVLSPDTRAKLRTWATQAGFEDVLAHLTKYQATSIPVTTWNEVNERKKLVLATLGYWKC